MVHSPVTSPAGHRGPAPAGRWGLTGEARRVAQVLLAGTGDRWPHTVGVARRAGQVRAAVPEPDRDLLVAAAWLHDIGYAAPLAGTGFHPLDGARWLAGQGWPARLCGLVAHHSGAWYVARVHGLHVALAAYPDERSPVTDALAYADQTVGPRGDRVSIEWRMADMLRRHGPDSANARAHPLRAPYLLASAARVRRRLDGLRGAA